MAEDLPITQADFDSLLDLEKGNRKNEDVWSQVKSANGVEVWTKLCADTPLCMVKAFIDFPLIPKGILLKLLRNPQLRKRYDTKLKVVEELEDLEAYKTLYYEMSMSSILLTNRDAVINQAVQTTDTETIVVNKHATHPSKPESTSTVRLETLTHGYIIRAKDGDLQSSTLTLIVHIDYKGNIPVSMVNMRALQVPEKLATLIRHFYSKTYRAETKHFKRQVSYGYQHSDELDPIIKINMRKMDNIVNE